MALTVAQLLRAIAAEDGAAVRRALDLHPALVHAQYPRDGATPLHAAAATGNMALLRELLHLGASCQAVDARGEAALHAAARHGHVPLVRELLADAGRRSCMKLANADGATPLHLAVARGTWTSCARCSTPGARPTCATGCGARRARGADNGSPARTHARARPAHTTAPRAHPAPQAGRTARDLVDPADEELAASLAQGRQLTPGSASRTARRIISPAMSPAARAAAARLRAPARHQMGPLHSARAAAGSAAGASAAAGRAAEAHAGGSSCIVSPEASAALLHAAPGPLHGGVAGSYEPGPLSAGVGYSIRQPLQAQLSALAGKVQQLEAWFEAQVELIPEWQRVLGVVHGLKAHLEEEQLKVDGHEERLVGLGQALESLADQAERVAEQQGAVREALSGCSDQIAQLKEQAARKRRRKAADEAKLASLASALSAATARLEAMESSVADGGARDARLAALEAGVAELRQTLAGLAPPAASSDAGGAHAGTAQDVEELRARVADLSAAMAVGGGAGGLEGVLLPFMETTSSCLAAHEAQLDAIQAVAPKLESVVAQRAQMCELMQQMAALQTAFNLLTGSKGGPGGQDACARPGGGPLSCGPLGSHKAAADSLALATSMVKLQSQFGALSAAVEQLQAEWEAAAAGVKADADAIRADWEAERARLAACEREAARRAADQQKELRAREERLAHIREAALAEEAARRSQLDSEARVSGALQGVRGAQEQLEGRLGGLSDGLEALREQVAALQCEVEASLLPLAPEVARIAAAQEGLQRAAPPSPGALAPPAERAGAHDEPSALAALRRQRLAAMAFTLPDLPYALDALEPHMSKQTLEFHWGKHHRAYVDNMNKQLAGSNLAGKGLEEIIKASWNGGSPEPVFNNAAQVWNHTFFWESMKPNGGGAPTGKLADAINASFGSLDEFKTQFKAAGATQFGSGWAWLVTDKAGKLTIEKTPNAVTPIAEGRTPILTMDVWEHAYYLDVQNRRPDYMTTFVDKLINWDAVAARLEAATTA
ncbi:hypothetical protein HT031_006941 [Scenedesmus sp. PABB004]|nr:hypothetical protein HT031_006941 [Scenedesmus sp. PABB004]